jgi:hypothetical protein
MAFTELGIAMISSVLNRSRAIQVNIQIIRIFTRIRQLVMDNAELRLEIEGIRTGWITRKKHGNYFSMPGRIITLYPAGT